MQTQFFHFSRLPASIQQLQHEGGDGCSEAEGSVAPCPDSTPWSPQSVPGKLLSCFFCWVQHQSIQDHWWGNKKAEVSSSVVWLPCVPGPWLVGSTVFSLGRGVLQMLCRERAACPGCGAWGAWAVPQHPWLRVLCAEQRCFTHRCCFSCKTHQSEHMVTMVAKV